MVVGVPVVVMVDFVDNLYTVWPSSQFLRQFLATKPIHELTTSFLKLLGVRCAILSTHFIFLEGVQLLVYHIRDNLLLLRVPFFLTSMVVGQHYGE